MLITSGSQRFKGFAAAAGLIGACLQPTMRLQVAFFKKLPFGHKKGKKKKNPWEDTSCCITGICTFVHLTKH